MSKILLVQNFTHFQELFMYFERVGSIDENSKVESDVRTETFNSVIDTSPQQSINLLSTSFRNDTNQPLQTNNFGLRLIAQQLIALFVKRFRTLYRRYLLALFSLILPVTVETILAIIIPPSKSIVKNYLFDSSLGGTKYLPPYELDLYKYGTQIIPIQIKDKNVLEFFTAYIDNQAKLKNKPRESIK